MKAQPKVSVTELQNHEEREIWPISVIFFLFVFAKLSAILFRNFLLTLYTEHIFVKLF